MRCVCVCVFLWFGSGCAELLCSTAAAAPCLLGLCLRSNILLHVWHLTLPGSQAPERNRTTAAAAGCCAAALEHKRGCMACGTASCLAGHGCLDTRPVLLPCAACTARAACPPVLPVRLQVYDVAKHGADWWAANLFKHKTYVEARSIANPFVAFWRVYTFHAVLLTIMAALVRFQGTGHRMGWGL